VSLRRACTAVRPLQRQVLCHDRRHAARRSLAAKLGRTPQRQPTCRHVPTCRRVAGCPIARQSQPPEGGYPHSMRRSDFSARCTRASECSAGHRSVHDVAAHMSASADISSSSFGIASGTRGTNLDVTRAFWRFHLPDGRHGSCLSCVIMSSTARHGDRWLPVLLVAVFLALAVGNGAASPAGGGGHGGGFSGGGHGGFDRGHGGGGFSRGREFGGRGFGARPVPHEHDGTLLNTASETVRRNCGATRRPEAAN
jgi:hypothetical protein